MSPRATKMDAESTNRRAFLRKASITAGTLAAVGAVPTSASSPTPEEFCQTTTLISNKCGPFLRARCDREVGSLSSVELILNVDPYPDYNIGYLWAFTGSDSYCPSDDSAWTYKETVDSGVESIKISNPGQYLKWKVSIEDSSCVSLDLEECS